MEKRKKKSKKRGDKRTKIAPYAATGVAMGMGLIDDTEDLNQFGGMLGVMGAFDPDDTDSSYGKKPPRTYRYQTDTHWEYDNIGSNASIKNDNKYAWRMNCEDGSDYGVSRLGFETRESYNAALKKRKSELKIEPCDSDIKQGYASASNDEQQVDKSAKYVLYRVSRLDNG